MGDNFNYFPNGNPFNYYGAFHNQSANHIRNDLIDPDLHSDGESMQRFLRDSHQPVFNTLLPQSQYILSFQGIYYGSTPSLVMSSSRGRGGSPFSQHQSSNTSSALSPQTDNEIYESAQGPPTPPGFLPDTWDDTLALTGISPYLPPNVYVNPCDIHSKLVSRSEEPAGSKDAALDPTLDLLVSSPSLRCEAATASLSSFPSVSVSSPRDEIHVRTSPSPGSSETTIVVKIENEATKVAIRGAQNRSTRRGRGGRGGRGGRAGPKTLPNYPVDSRSKVSKARGGSYSSRRLPSTTSNSLFCSECSEAGFKDGASLEKHIKAQHKRPFVCVFNFAGCLDAFASKNEWKRHVSSQHLNLTFWLCTSGDCGNLIDDETPVLKACGRPFRRKDLFTQHLRRMHMGEDSTGTGKKNKNEDAHEDAYVKHMQDEAFMQRCDMPQYMKCPAKGCSQEFRGTKAWDERMEHVARHLDAAANGSEPAVEFGGPRDNSLTNWASSQGVDVISWAQDGWQCCQPLKNSKTELKKLNRRVSDSEGDLHMEDSA